MSADLPLRLMAGETPGEEVVELQLPYHFTGGSHSVDRGRQPPKRALDRKSTPR
jgi:hypothetical protein